MARVTIERAYQYVDNRFELSLLASHRAHVLAYGGNPTVNVDNKYAVIALREIEQGKIDFDQLRESVKQRYSFENGSSAALNTLSATDFIFDDLFTENTEKKLENLKEKKINNKKNKENNGVKINTSDFMFTTEED